MINLPTTLVLGAGASMPYGFPSGYELRKRLCDPRRLEALYHHGLFSQGEVSSFCDAFLHSSIESIDAFLAKRGSHILPNSIHTFAEIGKAAIALVLISCEDSRQLFDMANEDHWYSHLWQILGTSVEDFESSRLSIVTFNYDRSLEHYLYVALKNSFGLSDEQALALLGKLRIIHVYGQIGELASNGMARKDARPYATKVSAEAISIAAKSLKVIPESRDDDDVFTAVRECLNQAERICFLGFGFDQTNVRRLQIEHILHDRFQRNDFRGPLAYSTTCGLAYAERSRVLKLLMPEVPNIHSWMHSAQSNYKILRDAIEGNIASHGGEKNRDYLRHTGLFH
jgi:hypothetical protein